MAVIHDSAAETFQSYDERRQQALIAADVDALGELLADEFTYVHASGRAENKQEYLATIGARRNRFLAFSGSPTTVVPCGDAVVATGLVTITMTQGGSPAQDRSFLFSGVLADLGSGWKLVLWQQTEKLGTGG